MEEKNIGQDENETDNFISYLLKERGISPKSCELYMYYYSVFPFKENITQENIKLFIRQRGNIFAVRAFCRAYLEFKGLHRTIDIPRAKTGAKKIKEHIVLTEDEINLLREGLYKQQYLRGLMFDILFEGGIRRTELTNIALNHFKWKEWLDNPEDFCTLKIYGKRNKIRQVIINPETAKKIFEIYADKFPGVPAEEVYTKEIKLFNFNAWHVWWYINYVSKKVLGRKIYPHLLRHTRATLLQKRGMKIEDIKNYLGHDSLRTTEIYLHTTQEESLNRIKESEKRYI